MGPFSRCARPPFQRRVDRFEIIPVNKRRGKFQAINPATGKPWVFWFVDNTCHSAGTYESPFNTLLAAQNESSSNQAIYVYPGDGTTNGMNQGIVLKNGQWLLGASIAQLLPTTSGTITIPSMASSSPNLTNTTGSGNVVTVAKNNYISDLNITTAIDHSSGIYATSGSSNLVTYRDNFSTLPNITTNGIYLLNPSGKIIVNRCAFDGFSCIDGTSNGDGIFIELEGTNLNALIVKNSTFENITDPFFSTGGNGIQVYSNSSEEIVMLSATGNTFNNFNSGSAINNLATIGTLNFIGNTCSNGDDARGVGNFGIITTLNFINNNCSDFVSSEAILSAARPVGPMNPGLITTINMSDNTFANFNNSVGIGNFQGSTITMINSTRNTFDGFTNESVGFLNENVGSTISTLNSTHDVFVNFSISRAFLAFDHCSITNLNVTADTFNNFSDSSVGIAIDGTSPIANTNIDQSSFENVNNSIGISYILFSGNTTAKITGNTFSGTGTLSSAWAAALTVAGVGTLCLDFTDNTATPASSPDPYRFLGISGTFNRTIGSDETTNVGAISTFGVNPPGSCSQ